MTVATATYQQHKRELHVGGIVKEHKSGHAHAAVRPVGVVAWRPMVAGAVVAACTTVTLTAILLVWFIVQPVCQAGASSAVANLSRHGQ